MDGDHYQVLFVEHDAEWAERISRVFAESDVCPASVDVVVDPPRALQAVHVKRYDAILVDAASAGDRGLDVIEALRTAGVNSAVIFLSSEGGEKTALQAMALGADDSLDRSEGKSLSLPRNTRHAIDRRQLALEKARLEFEGRKRLLKEKEEAEKLIRQQRHIIQELEHRQQEDLTSDPHTAEQEADASADFQALLERYRSLLRTYVVIGNDSLTEEVSVFTASVAADEVAPAELLQVHLEVVEQMASGLGERSARHVVSRAGMLILDIMVRLAQSYRARRSPWLTPPLEVVLVTKDDGTADVTQSAFSAGKLRSALTIVADASELGDLFTEADRSGGRGAPDLILWDADTLCDEDVEPLQRLQDDPLASSIPQVLLTGPGSLPLVPTGFQPMFGALTKPLSTEDLLGLIASLPNFWLSVCKLDAGS